MFDRLCQKGPRKISYPRARLSIALMLDSPIIMVTNPFDNGPPPKYLTTQACIKGFLRGLLRVCLCVICLESVLYDNPHITSPKIYTGHRVTIKAIL